MGQVRREYAPCTREREDGWGIVGTERRVAGQKQLLVLGVE